MRRILTQELRTVKFIHQNIFSLNSSTHRALSILSNHTRILFTQNHFQSHTLATPKMKCTIVISAFMATLLSSGVLAAPATVPTGVVDSGRSGYNGVEVTARDDGTGVETDGRSGYNSVEIAGRDDGTGAETDGRSGYNSVEIAGRDDGTDAETDGRSGYNAIEVTARDDGTGVETDGRSGYN
ncbi:hypothetical protein VMCG_09903 [Cytospora schulzeri]|uniref:Uncharacterized protein n=1 Tax=Cytospora schulzeri TaxID=448051 RepID=A0A423VDY7_9PEZI|nr:hypothetical protein VMCG_09903 [Valsa malicola]